MEVDLVVWSVRDQLSLAVVVQMELQGVREL